MQQKTWLIWKNKNKNDQDLVLHCTAAFYVIAIARQYLWNIWRREILWWKPKLVHNHGIDYVFQQNLWKGGRWELFFARSNFSLTFQLVCSLWKKDTKTRFNSCPLDARAQRWFTVLRTVRASLSVTFLQTLPELVMTLKGHSLSPRSRFNRAVITPFTPS